MFVKRVKARGITYLQLVEGYWQDGRAKHRLLKSLGREDQLDPSVNSHEHDPAVSSHQRNTGPASVLSVSLEEA
jgi:hypothetical protein